MPVNSQAVGKTYEPTLYAVGREKIKEYARAKRLPRVDHDLLGVLAIARRLPRGSHMQRR